MGKDSKRKRDDSSSSDSSDSDESRHKKHKKHKKDKKDKKSKEVDSLFCLLRTFMASNMLTKFFTPEKK